MNVVLSEAKFISFLSPQSFFYQFCKSINNCSCISYKLMWIYCLLCHSKSHVIDNTEHFTSNESISALSKVHLFYNIWAMISLKFSFCLPSVDEHSQILSSSWNMLILSMSFHFPFLPFMFISIYLKLPEILVQKNWVEVKVKCDRHWITSISKYRRSFNKHEAARSLFFISL